MRAWEKLFDHDGAGSGMADGVWAREIAGGVGASSAAAASDAVWWSQSREVLGGCPARNSIHGHMSSSPHPVLPRQRDEARAVLCAMGQGQKHERALLGRVWGLLQNVTVGFGCKPWRAATWFVVLLAIGGAVYSVSPPPPMKPGESPNFNAVIYALDLLLPIVDLRQQLAFNPGGATQWLSYGLVAAG
ncbi:hypothetical protein [Nonomuraea rubra]|uniref:hypothetical protein n=1 Tax=Nonomuraea rubra TaxID=46180 RepID=UPI0033F9C6F5